jgi:peroxiredoxin
LSTALIIGALLVGASEPAAKQRAKIGQPAPAFSLSDQDGRMVNLKDYLGKIVVLEWFNEECPIVQRHYKADTMNTLSAKYKDKGIVWLAINTTAGKSNASNKKAAANWKMDRPILNDADAQTVGHAYGATNTPGMYIVDKGGMLAYMGAIDDNSSGNKTSGIKNYVAQALDELLAGKAVSEPLTQQYGCTVKYK